MLSKTQKRKIKIKKQKLKDRKLPKVDNFLKKIIQTI